MGEKEKKSFIQKVVLWNVIAILSIFLLGMITILITKVVIEGQVLIDQISFASSITSIILAVMAMIYAFFQSRESSQQNVQVQNSLGKIDEKIIELISIKEEFSSLRIDLEVQSTGVNSAIEEFKGLMENVKDTNLNSDNLEDYASKFKNKIEEIEVDLNKIQENKKKIDKGIIYTTSGAGKTGSIPHLLKHNDVYKKMTELNNQLPDDKKLDIPSFFKFYYIDEKDDNSK